METILEARGLNKSFGKLQAVADLDLRVEKGQVYGLLGQNGAGKSTLIRMLLGLVFPDSGRINLMGAEFNAGNRNLLKNVGVIIERPDMYNYLSGWDNLRVFAALSRQDIGRNRLIEVLELVGLRGREQDKVKAYSLGMKQRLGIAIALVHDPALLILDEPTNGLDPQGIADMRKLILQLSSQHNKTILLSSHLLYEVEQMASHMLIMHKGRKIQEGQVKELIKPEETIVEIDILEHNNIGEMLKISEWHKHVVNVSANKLIFKIDSSNTPFINQYLVGKGIQVTGIQSKHSLEQYFLSLTND